MESEATLVQTAFEQHAALAVLSFKMKRKSRNEKENVSRLP